MSKELISMKTYRVSWTQGHKTTLTAKNKDDAKHFALHMPDRDRFVCVRNLSILEAKT